MDYCRQRPSDPRPIQCASQSGACKKNSASLLEALEGIIGSCAKACSTTTCFNRFREHILSTLLCLGRRTVTGIITTAGRQYEDWSAHYRMYSKSRVDPDECFALVREEIERMLPPDRPMIVALDDTLRQKSGTSIHGVAWRRDPLGPKFQANLVLAQRFIQLSAALSAENGSARMIPIDLTHAPSARKPGAKATEGQIQSYKESKKQLKLNRQATERIGLLRDSMDAERELILVADGSYTNGDFIKALPDRTTMIGRIRKDATLCKKPEQVPKTGRRPSYGPQIPTPEQIRKDQEVPWEYVEAFAAGKRHRFKVKNVKHLLWRKSGAKRPLQLLIIAPLGYRLHKKAKLLYRKPAYLICTDPQLAVEKFLQYYLWRWQIEPNFRDEKTLIGMGEAQVRTEASNRNLPALNVAAYSMLWLASYQIDPKRHQQGIFEPAKWRTDKRSMQGPTTSDLLQQLRYETWAGSLRPSSFSHFVDAKSSTQKSEKLSPPLASSLFQAA